MVYGLARNRRSLLSVSLPDDSPASRGLEVTVAITDARVFADQDEIDSFVASHGGEPSNWLAMDLPTL